MKIMRGRLFDKFVPFWISKQIITHRNIIMIIYRDRVWKKWKMTGKKEGGREKEKGGGGGRGNVPPNTYTALTTSYIHASMASFSSHATRRREKCTQVSSQSLAHTPVYRRNWRDRDIRSAARYQRDPAVTSRRERARRPRDQNTPLTGRTPPPSKKMLAAPRAVRDWRRWTLARQVNPRRGDALRCAARRDPTYTYILICIYIKCTSQIFVYSSHFAYLPRQLESCITLLRAKGRRDVAYLRLLPALVRVICV